MHLGAHLGVHLAFLCSLSSSLQKEIIFMVPPRTADLTAVSSGESHVKEGEWFTCGA